jgi:hypothetical protein
MKNFFLLKKTWFWVNFKILIQKVKQFENEDMVYTKEFSPKIQEMVFIFFLNKTSRLLKLVRIDGLMVLKN